MVVCKSFARVFCVFFCFFFFVFQSNFAGLFQPITVLLAYKISKGSSPKRRNKMANEPDAKTQITEFIKDLDKSISRASATEMLKLYDENFEIKFLGKTVLIPFDAVSYNAIEDALKTIAAEL